MIFLILLLALLVRILLLPLPPFSTDMSCWVSWASHIFNVGPSKFYNTIWSDYLPSYLYILWFLAFLHNVLSFIPYEYLLKLPSVFADLGTGWLIYKVVKHSGKSIRYAYLASGLYLFNLFPLFNGSVWGQVDSVYALIVLLSVYLLLNKTSVRYISWVTLGFGTLVKPQAIFFLPVFIMFEYIKKNPVNVLKGFSLYIIAVLLLTLPFFPYSPVSGIFDKVINSSSTYPYTSVNAINLWSIWGTWKPDSSTFFGLVKQYWGYILLFAGLCNIWWKIFKTRVIEDKTDMVVVYFSCAMITFSFFMLPTRVHERWLFAFFPFFLITCALINKKTLWFSYIALSIIHFLNLYYVYTYYNDNFLRITWLARFIEKNFQLLSIVSVIIFIYLTYYFLRLSHGTRSHSSSNTT